MIQLTVKTLDSQNHSFTVEDDITVEQFKVKIADTVNIPAETQRIIYCGRVLQDRTKLSDYDVDGKVVHLVQRAPPSANPRSRSASPQPPRRFRNIDHPGNAMYLSSVAFPSNLMESQGIVPPPPTHSLAGSRLNVARRMLRRAESVIRLLEDPNSRPADHPSPEENPEEEVTPVIEARVIVPNSNAEPIDEAMVLSAVQDTLLNATGSLPMTEQAGQADGQGEGSSRDRSSSSTTRASSNENLASESRSEESTGSSLAENASRTAEMAELLTMMSQLQMRLAPFLERYQTFMQEDPVVAPENARAEQTMLNRVSEVLHFFGHAYHSLSDILIRVRTAPPRPLLCRPILIQHSAIGIPIQVEAQINLSTERPPTTTSSGQTTNSSNTTTAAPPTSTSSNGSSQGNSAAAQPQPNIMGFPLLSAGTMRVQSFPVEIRTIRPNSQRSQNNNNNTVNQEGNGGNGNGQGASAASAAAGNASEAGFNFGNPNLEFFMEVTPEALRDRLNGPPQDLIQSLMQMAGQIIHRTAGGNGGQTPPNSTSTSSSTPPPEYSQSSASQGAAAAAGQNSQARGNTQTNPTTSTHTRSTARPHVHLAQQAMQGGFDPFLPCNSHHILPRRRAQPHGSAQGSAAGAQARQDGGRRGATPMPNQNVYNFFNGIMNTIRSSYRRSADGGAAAPSAPQSDNNAAQSGNQNEAPQPPIASLLSLLQVRVPDLLNQSLTIEQMFQQMIQDEGHVAGESIFTDGILLVIRNLTLVDLLSIRSGSIEPFNRARNDIQQFFMTRIINNDSSNEGIEMGAERIIREMQPFLEAFRRVRTHDDIDLVRSVERLFWSRLPRIIVLGINLNNDNSVRTLIDKIVETLKMLCALIRMSCPQGQQGVELVFEQVMQSFMQGIPSDVQNWSMATSRLYLRQLLSEMTVPDSEILPFIVRNNVSRTDSGAQTEVVGDNATAAAEAVEPMELDEQEATSSGKRLTSTTLLLDETETNIVLGSEQWHGQVPEDWVPIIARDAQKQRRQNAQGPFSDAYLSGMPSKRRKLVNSVKPQGSLPQVITESMRQAVTATGLAAVAPLEVVAQGAGNSGEIQNAYRSLLRSSVQASLRDNEDFTPERFPNASTYFNNTQTQ